MKFKDYFNLKMEEYGKALRGDKTDEELDVSLATDTLEDGTVLEYESLEVGVEVFVMVEGEDPKPADDKTYTLSDGQKLVVEGGKISEIKPKEEEKEEAEEDSKVELSEEQKTLIELATAFDLESLKSLVDTKKNGYHTIEFSVQDGAIIWADIYSNTYKTLLSEQVDPIKTELEEEKKETVKLKAQIVALQEQNDQKNPIPNVELKDEKPLTRIEQIKENIKLAQTIKD